MVKSMMNGVSIEVKKPSKITTPTNSKRPDPNDHLIACHLLQDSARVRTAACVAAGKAPLSGHVDGARHRDPLGDVVDHHGDPKGQSHLGSFEASEVDRDSFGDVVKTDA